MNQQQQALHLWGVPSDAGGNSPGARHAPQVLREQGLLQVLQGLGLQMKDCGNGVPLCNGMPSNIHNALTELATTVHDQVAWSLRQGAKPVLIGGDHSVVLGSVHAVAAHCRQQGMPLHVVWMDAHADFNTPESSPSGNVHGMPLASLCGLGPKPWVHLCQHPIALQGVQVSLVGVRDMDAEEKYLLDAVGVAVFDMQQIQHQGIHAVMNQVLASIPKGAHVHLSFDMDVMDPILAPGVDTAVPSGLDLSMAQHALSLLASVVGPHGQVGLGSVDWVELNPQRDHDYKTARLAIHLLGCALARAAAHTKPLLQGVA